MSTIKNAIYVFENTILTTFGIGNHVVQSGIINFLKLDEIAKETYNYVKGYFSDANSFGSEIELVVSHTTHDEL